MKNAARDGEHVTVVTATASGKTLCYNLPVIDAVLNDPAARAFYRAYFAVQLTTDEEMGYYFDAAVLMPMNFVLYGNPGEIWARIQWACGNRQWLMDLVNECRMGTKL